MPQREVVLGFDDLFSSEARADRRTGMVEAVAKQLHSSAGFSNMTSANLDNDPAVTSTDVANGNDDVEND